VNELIEVTTVIKYRAIIIKSKSGNNFFKKKVGKYRVNFPILGMKSKKVGRKLEKRKLL
jgi:hypothetical protein